MTPIKMIAINHIIKLKNIFMGKILNLLGEQVEVVSIDEARTFYRGRKKNKCMTRRSFMQMVYRRDKNGFPIIPKHAYTRTTRGNYWFNKNYLLGIQNKAS